MRRRSLVSIFVAGFLLPATVTGIARATGPGGWDRVGHGSTASAPSLDNTVYVLNTDNPGVLYAGGSFSRAGGVANTGRIARWNGSTWSPVGSASSTISNGTVNAIAYHGGKVYAGGTFTNAGGNADADFVAVWNGSNWAPVCDGAVPLVEGTVFALQLIGNTLYVGGSFAAGGGLASADRLVACNLDTQVASSTVVDVAHEFTGTVYALTADTNGRLYAGGGFTNLNENDAADNVAYLDNSGWHAMGSGPGGCGCAVDTFVRSLTARNSDVYVGTDAKDIAGIAQADNVARWDGSAWSAMGSDTAGTDGWFPSATTINALTTYGATIYATGNFGNANGVAAADEIAQYDGSAWHPVGSDGAGNGPLNARGWAIKRYSGRLYVGGSFTSAGGDSQAQFLAVYPGYIPVCTTSAGHHATGGAALPIALSCTDKNGQSARYAIHYVLRSDPSHGKLGPVGNAGTVRYTPTVGYTGPDSFTYRGSNVDGTSDTATISVTVTDPGYSNAGVNVDLRLGSFTAKPSGALSFHARNANRFALQVVSIRVASRSKLAAAKGGPRKIVSFVRSPSAVTIRTGKTASLNPRMSASNLALLKRLGHVRVRVSVVLKGPHGSHTTATTIGTLHASH